MASELNPASGPQKIFGKYKVESEYEAELAALRTRCEQAEQQLATIKEASEADAADLAQMRDGTKLTRAGVVEVIRYQQMDIADLKENLADARDELAQQKSTNASLAQDWKAATAEASGNERIITDLKAKLDQAEEDRKWICRKLEISETCEMFTGEISIAGTLHVWGFRQSGYMTYIEAYKCNDKQGEIARQSARIATLEARLKKAEGETQ